MAVKFVNFTNEVFAHPSVGGSDENCQYQGRPYHFPPKSEMIMEEDKALSFAKHLANRELYKLSRKGIKDRETESEKSARESWVTQMSPEMERPDKFPPKFKEFFYRAFIVDDLGEVESEMKPVMAGTKFCEFCDSKGVFHKKGCPVIANKKADETLNTEGTPGASGEAESGGQATV
jgi:hypothetical protein